MRAASAAPTTPSVTVDSTSRCISRITSAPGRLSHEGPELLRWALFEAAQQARRPASPEHEYYRQVARRIDHNRACLSVARKLCRRAYHILRELGDEALAPIDAPTDEDVIAAAA
jgi:transposase